LFRDPFSAPAWAACYLRRHSDTLPPNGISGLVAQLRLDRGVLLAGSTAGAAWGRTVAIALPSSTEATAP
jgi:hypothetical protein